MNIEIKQTTIGDEQVNSVSARELHAKLGLKSEFNNWIKPFLNDWYESIDYIRIDGEVNPANGVLATEYLFSIDMAKHVSILHKLWAKLTLPL